MINSTRNNKNLLWHSSCYHISRWVVIPQDFFIAKPSSNLVKHELPFQHKLKSCRYINYRSLKHTATLKCTGHAKWSSKLCRYKNSLPRWPSKWSPPHIANTGVNKRPDTPLRFLHTTPISSTPPPLHVPTHSPAAAHKGSPLADSQEVVL